MRRLVVCCCTLVVALIVLSRPQIAAAGLINVTMTADVNTGIFEVFAHITDTSTTGLGGNIITGLAGYAIDVTGSGAVVITTIANESPVGSGVTGFTTARSTQLIPGGMRAGALQNTSGSPGPLVLQGVGITAGSDGFGASWAVPVKLVSGTFVGVLGNITASPINTSPGSDLQSMSVMHGPGGVWQGGIGGQTSAPANSVTIVIPEPSTFGVLALAFSLAGAYRLRRRKEVVPTTAA